VNRRDLLKGLGAITGAAVATALGIGPKWPLDGELTEAASTFDLAAVLRDPREFVKHVYIESTPRVDEPGVYYIEWRKALGRIETRLVPRKELFR